MTRIAFLSDLHLEFQEQGLRSHSPDDFQPYGACILPAKIDADVIVIAGDTHPAAGVRSRFYNDLRAHYDLPVITVDGNHELYGSSFLTQAEPHIVQVNGVRFACATLWTELSGMDVIGAQNFSDFRHIRDLTYAGWNETHFQHLDFLRKAEADVIVTHHAPAAGSTHPRYAGDPQNNFFVNSRIDLGLFPKTKLWVHGHVHDPFDYQVEDVRVVCNPWGHPWEQNKLEIHYVDL